ncbi:hypothetical protein GGI17_005406 [Coemansia sp. S146]|nr:hypothetical protein GGI17_005406 [Coemansia sp. S146]
MDAIMPEGWHAFVKVLVNWSFCEKSQLGRDPTMEYLGDLGCWQIACPGEAGSMSDGAVAQDYYFSTAHEVVSAESPLKPAVVIKDSWAFSKHNADDDARDEVRSFDKVKKGLLEKAAELDIIIPEIVVGGRVSFQRNEEWVEDNTDTVYGVGEADDLSFRAHRRIVMRPIGEPLRSTKSVAEFVTVGCDGCVATAHLSISARFSTTKSRTTRILLLDSSALRRRARKTQPSEVLPMVNPFEECAKIWKDISEELLGIVNYYFGVAMDLQKKAIEAKSNAAIDSIPQ